jgi:short-subunit dehydrogenase
LITKKAIVIGASSGIGKELAKVLADNNYEVGLVARRVKLLEDLSHQIDSKTYIKKIDICKYSEAKLSLEQLIEEMGNVDLIVVNSGVRHSNPNLDFAKEKDTIDVNVAGFVNMAEVAINYFLKRGFGHLVGISSIAALVGSAKSPAYNASKAFVSNYLWGLKQKVINSKIYITDIRPGLINTPLVNNIKSRFWIETPQDAARDIFKAIKRKKQIAYITERWSILAWLLKILPENFCNYIYAKVK